MNTDKYFSQHSLLCHYFTYPSFYHQKFHFTLHLSTPPLPLLHFSVYPSIVLPFNPHPTTHTSPLFHQLGLFELWSLPALPSLLPTQMTQMDRKEAGSSLSVGVACPRTVHQCIKTNVCCWTAGDINGGQSSSLCSTVLINALPVDC